MLLKGPFACVNSKCTECTPGTKGISFIVINFILLPRVLLKDCACDATGGCGAAGPAFICVMNRYLLSLFYSFSRRLLSVLLLAAQQMCSVDWLQRLPVRTRHLHERFVCVCVCVCTTRMIPYRLACSLLND
jgi:hypothetical protein